jgi:signal transduction histidine kinase/ActR/RegA family two-component response regulator
LHPAKPKKLSPEPKPLSVATDDVGRILKGAFDKTLKAHLLECIEAFSGFSATGVPAMPYIAAWQKNTPGIWYEYTSPGFQKLFGCTCQDAAQVFRNSILDRRIYNRPAASGIHTESLAFHQLQDARKKLRRQSQSTGAIEALYRVRTACGEAIWLKDQAVIETHEPDGIFLSLGFLTMASKEIQARDEIRQDCDLLQTLVRERTTILKAINRSLLREITALKQAEREKAQLETQLQQAQKMEAIGTLAGGIAHDFNNLLMGIQGAVSLMELDTGMRHTNAEHLKSISRCVQNGARLTKQLLGFARKGRYEIKPIDINELVQKTSTLFGRTHKEITIHTHLNEQVWVVEADQGQIEQVLLNCYVNAWQAMPNGGRLNLKTENWMVSPPEPGTQTSAPGRYVRVTIQDTGIGMDPETLERIFEPFFTTKEIGIGTGLGLASAYGIVKNHSGFIDVFSQKNKGSVFHIYLPATVKPLCSRPLPAPELPVRGSATILLVDDEQIIIDTLQPMLRKLGYRVITACSGQDALAIFREKGRDIDLVMLDLIMPGMGGDAVFDGLRQQRSDAKILLFSGYDAKANVADILNRGCNGFIQKPFSLAALSDALQKILRPVSAHRP